MAYDPLELLWNLSHEVRGMERVLFGKTSLSDEMQIHVTNLTTRLKREDSRKQSEDDQSSQKNPFERLSGWKCRDNTESKTEPCQGDEIRISAD